MADRRCRPEILVSSDDEVSSSVCVCVCVRSSRALFTKQSHTRQTSKRVLSFDNGYHQYTVYYSTLIYSAGTTQDSVAL